MNRNFLLPLALLLSLFSSIIQAEMITLPKINERGTEKFHRFHSRTAKGLQEFVTSKPELQDVTNVFYPFGGADILYPLIVFPNARQIVIVGLERIGRKSNFSDKDSIALCDDVNSLLRSSFFVTMDMNKNFSTKNIGIERRILEQLALLGISEADIEVFDHTEQKFVINFTYKGVQRSVSYFKKNFLNIQSTTTFLSTLQIQGILLKATSYTLHRKEFSHVRDFIVKSGNIIVEDDSGVPLRYLKQAYKIEKFGQYTKPYGAEFACYTQNDLFKEPSVSDKKLDFCFGYGCKKQPTTLIIAKKI